MIHERKDSIAYSLAQISLHFANSWIRNKAVGAELKNRTSSFSQELTIAMHCTDDLRIPIDTENDMLMMGKRYVLNALEVHVRSCLPV